MTGSVERASNTGYRAQREMQEAVFVRRQAWECYASETTSLQFGPAAGVGKCQAARMHACTSLWRRLAANLDRLLIDSDYSCSTEIFISESILVN
mgnify:CR=1 FL=1